MKKCEINNIPAGSIVIAKSYNRWKRLIAKLFNKKLKYNDVWIDPFGGASFLYEDSLFVKHDVWVFKPRKQYSKKEKLQLYEEVLPKLLTCEDPTEALLLINLVRPNTFSGSTLEELLDNNKYYNKTKVK